MELQKAVNPIIDCFIFKFSNAQDFSAPSKTGTATAAYMDEFVGSLNSTMN